MFRLLKFNKKKTLAMRSLPMNMTKFLPSSLKSINSSFVICQKEDQTLDTPAILTMYIKIVNFENKIIHTFYNLVF